MKKNITFVSPRTEYCPFMAQLSEELDIKINHVSTISELFPLLSDTKFSTDLILLDIQKLYEVKGTSMFDIIRTLSTLLKCTVHRLGPGQPTRRTTLIGAVVALDTDMKLIREVLSIVDVKGLYPRGDDFSIEEKKDAVLDLISGQCHIPDKINRLLYSKKKNVEAASSSVILTPRQSQILDLLMTRGASNKVIAKILAISESTVKLHMGAILKKYGVRNRTQLAVFNKEEYYI